MMTVRLNGVQGSCDCNCTGGHRQMLAGCDPVARNVVRVSDPVQLHPRLPSLAHAPQGLPWRYIRSRERINVDLRYDHRHPFKRKNRASTLVVSFISRCLMVTVRLRYRITIQGNFPAGGCVAVSLHENYLDAIVPVALDSRVTPVVSALCLRSRARSWILENYGVIWAGPRAITQGAEVVRAGKVCWLAPHGFGASRHGTTYPKARLGAARIALLEMKPVVGIASSTTKGWRPGLQIEIMRPVWPLENEKPRQFTERFMSQLGHGESS